MNPSLRPGSSVALADYAGPTFDSATRKRGECFRNLPDIQIVGQPAGARIRRIMTGICTRALAILLASGMLALLVRYSPGFEADERDLEPTLSAASRETMHSARAAERNVLSYIVSFTARAAHGDFGVSRVLDVPVRDLIAQRGPITAQILLKGAGYAWLAALTWTAVIAVFNRRRCSDLSIVLSTCVMCVPVAVLAVFGWHAHCSPDWVLAIALLPKIFQVARTLVAGALNQPDVLAAKSRGIGSLPILLRYILPKVGGPLLAWMAATAGMAIGALIPIEVIFDVPGLGQLVWKAALARDLPVLLTVTTFVAIIIQFSNLVSSAGRTILSGEQR